MISEKDVYAELAEAPALPDEIYTGVMKTVRRRSAVRGVLSIAAMLTITIGTAALVFQTRQTAPEIAAEVTMELESIAEYINGEDIGSEMEAYAFYTDE